MSSDDEPWLEAETSVEQATGPAAAAVLSAVVGALEDAPPEKRFDVSVEVEER